MLRLMNRVLKGLEILPDNMRKNLELSQGLLLAERVVNFLVGAGVPRQEAHDRVRKVSLRALDNHIPFAKCLQEDIFISRRLKPKEIREALDYKSYLGVTDQLISIALRK